MNTSKFQLPSGLCGRDFHTLSFSDVERVLAAADQVGYRRSRNANGSRARYFHAACIRTRRSLSK